MTSLTVAKGEWSFMPRVDNLPSVYDTPLQINKHEIVLATRSAGLCKYNIATNEWIPEWIQYPSTIRKLYTPRSTFDCVHNLVYIYDSYGQLLCINISTKQCEIITDVIKISYPRIIYTQCNDTLHLFGGAHNDMHYIYDKTKRNFVEKDKFEAYEGGLAGFGIIYMQSHSLVMILGGFEWELGGFSDEIHEYDMVQKQSKWQEVNPYNIRIPHMSRFAYTLTKNEEYILLLGGFEDFEDIDDIFVIQRNKTFEVRRSDIKCPKASKDFHAITMIDEAKDELIVAAFVHNLFQQKALQSMQLPPMYIIKLISSWYANEYLHLFEQTSPSLSHWIFHIDDILSSVS